MNSSFDLRSAATTRSSERLPWIGSGPQFRGSAADESGLSSRSSDNRTKINYFSGRGIPRSNAWSSSAIEAWSLMIILNRLPRAAMAFW